MRESFTHMAQRVRAHLGQEHRYAHTVRVARCADVLAQRHRLDASVARRAGMLHDLARLYPGDRLISECAARGMSIDAFERANPVVLHARLGAAIAREQFGVRDEAVLSAIEKHTTAAAAMSPLDCVVYLADGLESGRHFAERAALWELANADLHAAMRGVLLHTVAYLAKKGIPVAPQTADAARAFGLHLQEVSVSAN
jgi:predicted HD superfamily hydrolase involved in NAD metabolism